MTMRVDFCPHCEPTAAGHAPGCPYEPHLPPAARKDEATFLETFLELPEREEEVHKISDSLAHYQARFEKATSTYFQAIATLFELNRDRE